MKFNGRHLRVQFLSIRASPTKLDGSKTAVGLHVSQDKRYLHISAWRKSLTSVRQNYAADE